MRLWHTALVAALLALAFPAGAQQEEAYFSLSSNRTFGPGQRPSIQLWGHGLDLLQFRVYRVNDPVAFFERIEDEHRFGGRAVRPPRKLTPLERLHRWKGRQRAWMRDLVRSQFRREQRWVIRDWWQTRRQQPVARTAPPADEFARVPLLNPQQVVAVWQQRVSRRQVWTSEVVPVPVKDKGLYLVEATDGKLQAYTIVSITELAVIAKGSLGRVLARVVNRHTGEPAEGCPVIVRVKKQPALKLRAGAQGMLEVAVKEPKPESVLLLARQGEDFAAVSMYGWSLGTDPERNLRGYIYTDRPVYRPGHTVYFRGVLRAESGAGYELPELQEAQIEIQSPDGKPVSRQMLPVSGLGAFHGELKLLEETELGYYSIELLTGEAMISGGFHVEEYKKPEYEVKITPAARRVLQGQPFEATLEARYYYGEPVTQAKVTYAVHRSRYWPPFYYREEESADEEGEAEHFGPGGEQVLEGSGELDAQGRLSIRAPTEVWRHDVRYRITARVTDAANREIENAAFVVATLGSYLVHVEPDRYVYSAGETARLTLEARDYDGNPVAGAAFRLEVFEHRWQQPPGPVITTLEGRTDAAGKATVEAPLPQGGSFRARAVSRTPEGREVEDLAYLWVAGGESWYGARGQRVELVPDKKSYRPGEVAKVLIIPGVPDAHLWITVEGREVRTLRTILAKSPTVTVEVPIRAEYAPNFFVSAVFVRGHQLYQGSKSIQVPPLEQQLQVEVSSPKTEFRPGESALYTLEARDHAGRPVAAEFSLGVVDEAIYAVRPERGPDILKFFYGRTYNRVSTDTSLSYYFQGEAGKRRMPLAWVRPAGALAQLKPEKLVQPEVRKAFPDTIFWVADLRTDLSGRAQARVSFPDALTTWRATARGVTADTKVGSALQRVIVRKNLILRLAVPRFFTQGDEVTISAIVHNYLASAKPAQVSLAVEGLEMIEGRTTEISVASRGQAQVDFRVRAGAPGQAVLLAKALTDEESDALELTLPVRPYGVKLSSARAGVMGEASEQADLELSFPPDATAESRSLIVEVTPTLAGAMFGALDYLTSFPYGCTEQTMSSFLPNVMVAQAVKELGLKSGVDEAALRKKIRQGLERLDDFQHPDGGWGWWQTDESHVFMTAYVVAGLAQARRAGHTVNEAGVARGASWLRERWPKLDRAPADLRAYVLYALLEAGQREPAWLDALWNQRREMSPYGLALLGLAIAGAGDPRAAEVAAELEGLATADDREAFWKVPQDALLDIPMEVTPEATAHALKLLTRLRPQSPLLPKAALYLVNHRDQGGWWGSTKQTAMVVYGLTDYLRQSRELRPNFTATVWVNDKPVLERRFSEADPLAAAPAEVRIPAAQLAPGANRVRLSRRGEGRLYWSARAEYYSTADRLAPSGTVSLNLLRDYFRLAPSQEQGRIVYRLEPVSGSIGQGDVIAVRLTVSGGDWRYLIFEDPIPAGAEFIARDDLYEIRDKPSWWQSWYTRREFHDDRAALFQTYFYRGQAQFFYLLKVVTPGRFRVSPARVQPMYQPAYLATTESRVLEVR
jgi:hypothetical protein